MVLFKVKCQIRAIVAKDYTGKVKGIPARGPTMVKLVVLKLEGDIQDGLRAGMEIGLERDRPGVEVRGRLPQNSQLIADLQDWENKYDRAAESPWRLKVKKIIYNGYVNWRQECRTAGQQLSQSFNEWLADDEFRSINLRLREELDRNETIRVLIRTENKELRKLPWHLWDFFSNYPKAELAFSPLVAERPPQRKPKAKVKILAIIGHGGDIDTQADREELEKLADAEITFLVEPRRQEINDKLWEEGWDILFFAGHSQTEGEKGRIYINPEDSLTIEELKYGLGKAVAGGLQFAIFNSCDGLGLARELAALQVPQAIVMRKPVPDEVAQDFLKYFLPAFASGQPFYLAVREARERLQGLENEFPCATWLPIICQNPAVVPPSWQDLLAQPEVVEPLQLDDAREPEPNMPEPTSPLPVLPRLQRVALAAIAVGAVGLGLRFGLPKLAKLTNNIGFKNYAAGRLPEAREAFLLASALHPNNRAAPYNLARICEKVQDFDCAKDKYMKSAKLGLSSAYSQLARLYIIRDRDYAVAANLSWQGLEQAKDNRVKYALYKNLGWARLGQGRYEEASQHLNDAIALYSDRASAHCLLAQVLEGQGDVKAALAEWKICLKYAKPQKPDEDIWIDMGHRRLQSVAKESNSKPI